MEQRQDPDRSWRNSYIHGQDGSCDDSPSGRSTISWAPEYLDREACSIFGCRKHNADGDWSLYKQPGSLFADSFSFSCVDCMATLPRNADLCAVCQKWNVAETVFKPSFGDDKNFVDCRTMKDYLRFENCLICRRLATAILEKFKETSPPTSLEKLLVVNCGPYWYDSGPGSEYSESFPLANLAHREYTDRCIFLLIASEDAHDFLAAGIDRSELSQRALSDAWRSSSIAVPLLIQYKSPGMGLEAAEHFSTSSINTMELRDRIKESSSSDQGSSEDDIENVEITEELEIKLKKPVRLRLVDTRSLCIVQPELKSPRYAALSYLWASSTGQSSRDLTKSSAKCLGEPGALSEENQPFVIWDAIVLCQDIGIDYLWTDRLCMRQDDENDKAEQISQMDRIYGHAAVTIVDVVDHEIDQGLPGVRGRARRTFPFDQSRKFDDQSPRILHNMTEAIDHSVWNTRGWTFQERMMSRCALFISNYQWYLDGKIQFQEDFGHVGDYSAVDTVSRSNMHSPSNIITSEWDYTNLIEHYTRRKLTNRDDILAAFTGIANVISRQSDTEHLFGLFADHFDQYLIWGYVGTVGLRTSLVQDLPTWTWAAWEGSVWYHSLFEDFYHDSYNIGKLVTFHLVRADGRLSILNVKETWFRDYDGYNVPLRLQNKYLGYGQTTYRSDDPDKDWRNCPHNPWTMLENQKPDTKVASMAASHSKALVFRTTVASLYLSNIQITQPLREYEGKPADMLCPAGVVYILHEGRRKIGYLQRLEEAWAEKWLSTSRQYDFVVLSAGMLPDAMIFDLENPPEPVRALFDDECKSMDPSNYWTLNVMVVERDTLNPAVCRRLAIGFVLMKFWESCQPRWETVILA